MRPPHNPQVLGLFVCHIVQVSLREVFGSRRKLLAVATPNAVDSNLECVSRAAVTTRCAQCSLAIEVFLLLPLSKGVSSVRRDTSQSPDMISSIPGDLHSFLTLMQSSKLSGKLAERGTRCRLSSTPPPSGAPPLSLLKHDSEPSLSRRE